MRWLVAAATLLVCTPAAPYVRTSTADLCSDNAPTSLFWHAVTVPFVIDAAGTPDVPGDAAVEAVRRSFRTWEEVPGAYLRFRYDGTVRGAPVGYEERGPNLRVVKWIESGWEYARAAIAITNNTFECATGQILDSDVSLNGEHFRFGVLGEEFETRDRADIQNTITHEVGHVIGFDHTSDRNTTMYAQTPLGEIRKRNLSDDEIHGMTEVYPVGREPKLGPCALDATCRLPAGGCDAVPGGWGFSLAGALLIAWALGRVVRQAKG